MKRLIAFIIAMVLPFALIVVGLIARAHASTATITISHSGQTCTSANCTEAAGEIEANAASNNINVNLLAASGTNTPVEICKTDSSTHTVTVVPNGTDKISGMANYVLPHQGDCVKVVDRTAGTWRTVAGMCLGGGCPAAPAGMTTAASDNSTALNNDILSIYQTGSGSAVRGALIVGPDQTGGTTYTITSGVDFKGVPVRCEAGRSSGNSAGQFNITLHFSGTSGIAAKNVQSFKNCRVVGDFAVGNGVTATISNITDGANGQATVTLSSAPANAVIAGMTVNISSTTNYNGFFPVASVTDSTHFVIDTGNVGTGTESSGTVKYYPTVGVMASANSSVTAVSGVDWDALFVQGFGTDFSLASVQTGAGSINNWRARNLYAGIAQVGVMANGNGFVPPGSNSNVAGGKLDGLQCVSTAVCLYGGPMNNNTSGDSDVEETSFSANQITGVDFETADTNSADAAYTAGLWIGGYQNYIGPTNYIGAGSSAGAGQTAKGAIRTADGQGPNFIMYNRVGAVATGIVPNTSADIVQGNVPGISANQAFGEHLIGGMTIDDPGQTPNAISATCNGSCATAGSGGTIHTYALVGIGKDGNRDTVSPQFICPDGVTYVASGSPGSCPGTNVGPTTYSGSNFMTICYPNRLQYKAYDLLIDDTTHSVRTNFGAGSNNNNCIPDTTGSGSAYSLAPASGQVGGINETNAKALNFMGPILGSGTPTVTGGGSKATGSNSAVITVTSAAATGNVVTPGFTCPNAVVCFPSDETTAGGAKVTASSTTSCTFSATASDTVDVWASCR